MNTSYVVHYNCWVPLKTLVLNVSGGLRGFVDDIAEEAVGGAILGVLELFSPDA